MLSWFSKRSSSGQPMAFPPQERWWATEFPDWARPLETPERLGAFLDGVAAYFTKRNLPSHIHPSGAVFPNPNDLDEAWGLANLLQSCADRAPAEFPGLIAAHFDLLDRARTQRDQLTAKLADWDFARPRIRIRLWDDEMRQALLQTITRESIPGLLSALAIDLPETIDTVSTSLARTWDKTPVELFDIARENTWNAVKPRPKLLSPEHLGTIHIVEEDSYYTASIALQIDRLPQLIGEHGVFISVPTRGGMLALPFNAMPDLQLLAHMIRFTRHAFEHGPGSVSHRLWWYRMGTWHEIPYESDPERISVLPPPEFEKYVSTIAPQDPDDPEEFGPG